MKRLTCICSGAALLAAGAALVFSITGPSLADIPRSIPAPGTPAAEIERLTTLLPDQAHVMADVGYHFTNAWFAGKAENWPLAKFFLDETRSHILWALRVKPVRKTAAGADLPLQPHADAVINGPMKELSTVIEKQQGAANFEKAYTATLNGCYACHIVSEKPYLKLRLPEHPAAGLIDFVPAK